MCTIKLCEICLLLDKISCGFRHEIVLQEIIIPLGEQTIFLLYSQGGSIKPYKLYMCEEHNIWKRIGFTHIIFMIHSKTKFDIERLNIFY